MVGDVAHRVDVFLGWASRDQHVLAGQGQVLEALGGALREVGGFEHAAQADVAAGLVRLGTASGATGQIWHLPVAAPLSTRQLIEQVYALAGHKTRVLTAGRKTLRGIGLFKPQMREYLHTLYQFNDPWVVDDGKFRASFGDLATPLDEALAATLGWYADRVAAPAH